MIKRLPDGRWRVDVKVSPSKRYRKTLGTKAEALRFEAHVKAKHAAGEEWNSKPKDRRRLSDLIALWYDLHGHSLRDGERRRSALDVLASRLGDPVAADLSAHLYASDRRKRLDVGITRKTLNNELGYVRAVYNELRSLGHIEYENPLATLKPYKIQEQELSWLTQGQIRELLEAIRNGCDNPHVELITLICLATGARWSEAEGLTPRMLQNNTVTFAGTKSGRVRSVPIDLALADRIKQHWKRYGPFTGSLSSFRRALKRTSIELPPGQASHVLRHTFASHFMQNGGNILTLQRILGHSTVTITMRYAHLAPDHLEEAVRLGPLASGTLLGHFRPKKQKALENLLDNQGLMPVELVETAGVEPDK